MRAIIWNAILAVSWRCVSGTRVAGSGGVAVALVEKWIIPKLRWEMRVKWVYLSPSDAKDSVNKQAVLSDLARWQLDVDELPSMEDLMAWNEDGICETPTGHRVEPDGTGPDGVPSWLRALRLIMPV